MNETDMNEINFNGVIYVRKDSITEAKPTNTEGMPYVIYNEAMSTQSVAGRQKTAKIGQK